MAESDCPLSERTEALLARLFPDAGPQARVREALLARCGRGVPFCADGTPESMERIRFAVLKLCEGDLRKLEPAIALANVDWRDLFMNADFGHDVNAHRRWADSVLGAAR